MSKVQVNGVTGPPSDVLKHITSYPLVSDAINYYLSFPLGKSSVEFSQNVYNAWGKPVLSSPIVQNPYSIIYPYAKKVDQLGDNTLTSIDQRIPALKETDFKGLQGYASSAAQYPFKVATESKDYVFNTYGEEYKKAGGDGVIPAGKAVVTTEIRIAAEALNYVAAWLGPKKDEAEKKFQQFINDTKQASAEKKKELENDPEFQKFLAEAEKQGINIK